jgi:hypothetical protein
MEAECKHEVDVNRVNRARDRACILSQETKEIHYAVRVGGVYGPTTRDRGWSECFGVFENGEEKTA